MHICIHLIHLYMLNYFTRGMQSIAISMFVSLVCLFLCLFAYLKNHVPKFLPIFCTCYLRPWLGPRSMAVQCCILWYCGWRHVFTQQRGWASSKVDVYVSPGGGTGSEVCRLRLHLVNWWNISSKIPVASYEFWVWGPPVYPVLQRPLSKFIPRSFQYIRTVHTKGSLAWRVAGPGLCWLNWNGPGWVGLLLVGQHKNLAWLFWILLQLLQTFKCNGLYNILLKCYFIYSAWGQGTLFPPLLLSCPFTSSSFALYYFFPFFIHFTYFLLLSIRSLFTRIVPLRFQAGGRGRRPNLGLVCFVYNCVICIA